MTTQPEALRLADWMECNDASIKVQNEAAAELRRLHENNQELLDLLKRANSGTGSHTVMWQSEARAAIAKGEGEKT